MRRVGMHTRLRFGQEEETKLFSNRLRNAFEVRFEPAAIYDRAGNQLRFLNRKTSGRDEYANARCAYSSYRFVRTTSRHLTRNSR
ncbi:hypothetical protein ACFW04_001838 [Cataglyphis niger]